MTRMIGCLIAFALAACAGAPHTRLDAWSNAYNARDLVGLVNTYAPGVTQDEAVFTYGGLFDQAACTKVTIERCDTLSPAVDRCDYVADIDGKMAVGTLQVGFDDRGRIVTFSRDAEQLVNWHHRSAPFAHLTAEDRTELAWYVAGDSLDVATTIGCVLLKTGAREANPLFGGSLWPIIPAKVAVDYGTARMMDRDRRHCKNPNTQRTAKRVFKMAPGVINLAKCL